MSGLQARADDSVNGVDVREQGSALRVATNTPHLVSLGTGRLSTAVTLHPIKQGRVSIGSDPTCDIYVVGTGVASVHCRVENSHGVVTLYPVSGSTLLDGLTVDKPTRLSQGSMLTIGRSNYLRFNHPEEAKLMKSVLPSHHVSMAPIQFQPNDQCLQPVLTNNLEQNQGYQNTNGPHTCKDNSLSQLDQELNITLKEMSKKKPPVVPRKPYRDLDYSDSNSDQECKPKMSSIMAKVSKFEYYAKQQKIGRSQFYTSTTENEISPKVFSSNSLTVNTPAKDVLGGKSVPNYISMIKNEKIFLENNAVDPKGCSYANVTVRSKNKIGDIVRNFDENSKSVKLPKKINNDQANDNIYGKIAMKNNQEKIVKTDNNVESHVYGKIREKSKPCLPSPSYDRDPHYSPLYANCNSDRNFDAESRRIQAYQDRVKEEEQKEAENARLEEILNMCAEYEKQIATGIPITPTEKRPHNKIITNGSLPRSVAMNNPNFVQTSEGYYKFDTSHNRNNSMSNSLPIQRNISSYENFDFTSSTTSHFEFTDNSRNPSSYENIGRMDELGIPVFDESPKISEISSPVMIRKPHQNVSLESPKSFNVTSPMGSPYENLGYNRSFSNFKPKSPNTQSPRTRIKTTFAHKNLPSPQYFVFPSPPPLNNLKSESIPNQNPDGNIGGIERQLRLKEEIPMIDDSDLSNDIEFRHSKVVEEIKSEKTELENTVDNESTLTKNQSFDDVKNELMADIPELEEFEKDLKQIKQNKVIKNVSEDIRKTDIDNDSLNDTILEDDIIELKAKYENLKEKRKKFLAEIHEIKCKMSEIRSQEDDILRELEMEKALIKGEYDSEIAILNIEQKKKAELLDKTNRIHDEIKKLKGKLETRQNEMRDRVEIATLKVERIERDIKEDVATVEELQNAQDILDNETKIFEDLEFQHLEEESELLAHREDLQNKIMHLTKKIEAQKTRILTLKSEANNNLTSALDETKILQAEYVRLLNQVEVLTCKVQIVEKELKPLVTKLNDIERTQSPDSAFYTDQTRSKSGEFGYSPQSSDTDDLELIKASNFEDRSKEIKEKFNSIDQMSQSMIVDIERRVLSDVNENAESDIQLSESPSKSFKEKKGFWERNFDSLKRKNKKPKSPEKVDIMSQSLNENIFYNNETIENDNSLDRFNSLRNSKDKKKDKEGPIKSSSSSKIPTFAALGKIIKKDSFSKRNKNDDVEVNNIKNRYVKNSKGGVVDNKYVKAKSSSPDKNTKEMIKEETIDDIKNADLNISFNNNWSMEKKENGHIIKVFHRKSCGDEPNSRIAVTEFQKITDSTKVPSQDDIDRISKVTLDAPILTNDTDMNSLDKRTLDSLMEIERKRFEMLEEQGCQMIENEREKISELKKRAQDETKKLWDQKNKEARSTEQPAQMNTSSYVDRYDKGVDDEFNMTGSTLFEDSSGFMSSSIEELQVRNSRADSTEDDKRSDDSRPLSHASDFSRDHILSKLPRRSGRGEWQRPLTRYLPVDSDDFDLRTHIESAGHQIELCPYLTVTSTSCRGYLHKLGAKFHTWSKRWFVFDRETKTFVYYWDKSEKKPRGGAYFQVIEEVYLDHGNTSKSPNPQTTFIVKTRQRRYYLMAPSGEAARIWIDVVFTGAQGYTEFLD